MLSIARLPHPQLHVAKGKVSVTARRLPSVCCCCQRPSSSRSGDRRKISGWSVQEQHRTVSLHALKKGDDTEDVPAKPAWQLCLSSGASAVTWNWCPPAVAQALDKFGDPIEDISALDTTFAVLIVVSFAVALAILFDDGEDGDSSTQKPTDDPPVSKQDEMRKANIRSFIDAKPKDKDPKPAVQGKTGIPEIDEPFPDLDKSSWAFRATTSVVSAISMAKVQLAMYEQERFKRAAGLGSSSSGSGGAPPAAGSGEAWVQENMPELQRQPPAGAAGAAEPSSPAAWQSADESLNQMAQRRLLLSIAEEVAMQQAIKVMHSKQ